MIPELSEKQLNRLSEFLSNFALLIVASLVIPNAIGTSEPNIIEFSGGIILTILLLSTSMVILGKDK